MGLYRFKPMPSGRMGIFWTLSSIKNSAVVEFGCMGHNLYSGGLLFVGIDYDEKKKTHECRIERFEKSHTES